MDLDFTDEQEMLRDLVRGVCSSYASLTTVREMEDDPVGYPAEFWKQLAALDLTGLLIPEEYGGSGMTALEGAVVHEELGRALAPSPHFVSAVLSATILLQQGTDEQRTTWLPRIASGESILTVATLEPKSGFGPKGVQARATEGADGTWTLTGTKWHTPFASSAERIIVLARTGDADTDVGLFLVDPAAAGVTLTQQMTVASDTQYQVELAGAPAELVGQASGWDGWHRAYLESLPFLAALAIGGAAHALEITVQYAKDREQFDKPLGAFQAISHYLADASTTVSGGRILAYESAWALANGQSVAKLGPMAKLFAGQTYRDVTAMAQQVFGGVGFTLEYDIQLYFRRAKQLQLSWGDDRYLSDLIATEVLDAPA